MNFLEIQISFIVIAFGFYYFVNSAWKERKNSFNLKSFFLGGARVGPELTENNTLGMTFAWSGGIWFFATLAFFNGPWVLLLQLPWCLSVIFLAYLFTKIHTVTKNKTIHGFLEDAYGSKVRIIAAIATTLGYIFNTGFEIYWSSLLLSYIVGHPELAIWVALILALITAVYCSIGGYRANATTDKPQNILGVIALSALSLFVTFNSTSDILKIASLIFSGGSLIYVLCSLYLPKVLSAKQSKLISAFALILAGLTILITYWLCSQDNGQEPTPIFSNSPFPYHLIIGIVTFQLFFNIVDMANWQGIAANGDIGKEKHKELKWSIIRSALYLNWFPALGGVIIGLALRTGYEGISDSNIFQFAFSTVLPNENFLIRGLALGFLLLGFIATTLSTADSYLMSASHTLAYDFLYHDKIRKHIEIDGDEDEEIFFVMRAKQLLMPLAILMVLTFWGAYLAYPKALDFQMIMYSFALSLFPSVMYGLFRGVDKAHRFNIVAFFSIAFGLIASITPYLIAIQLDEKAELRGILVNLTPVFSLITSITIFIFGILIQKFRTRHG